MDAMEKRFDDSIARIEASLDGVHERITDLFNHQSTRIPPNIAWALAGLSSLLTAVIVAIISNII